MPEPSLCSALPVNAPWHGIAIPEGYELSESGLFRVSGSGGSSEKIAGAVWVKAHTQDDQHLSFGLVVAWIDCLGKLQELALPKDLLHDTGKTLAQRLARRGLDIIPGKERLLTLYLGHFAYQVWMQSVSRLGWLDSVSGDLAYVLPESVICRSLDKEIIFQPEQFSPSTSSIKCSGSLPEWQQSIALPCTGNPYLIFSLCLGFTGFLLKPAGLENGGFHLYGKSSRGKTTAAQITASVLGCGADPADAPEQSYIQKWNTTHNALEALTAAHNDSVLILDEIHTCDAPDFGRVVYNLMSGKGKSRLSKDSELRASRAWRALVLSTGEMSSQQKIEESGKKAYAGQLLRLIDIPTGENLIEETHGHSASDFVLRLKRTTGQYYGTAGQRFLNQLIEDVNFNTSAALSGYIKTEVDNHTKQLLPDNVTQEQHRAVRRLALVKVAGLMAINYKILPAQPEEITGSINTIVKAWLTSDATLPDSTKAIITVQQFIQKHRARFQDDDNHYVPQNLVGYINRTKRCFMFTPEGFAEACQNFNVKDTARELQKLGYLVTNERSRYQTKQTIFVNGQEQRPRLYVIKESLIEFDEGACGALGQ